MNVTRPELSINLTSKLSGKKIKSYHSQVVEFRHDGFLKFNIFILFEDGSYLRLNPIVSDNINDIGYTIVEPKKESKYKIGYEAEIMPL